MKFSKGFEYQLRFCRGMEVKHENSVTEFAGRRIFHMRTVLKPVVQCSIRRNIAAVLTSNIALFLKILRCVLHRCSFLFIPWCV